ncbi:glycine cleavage system H protein [Virgisporangium aliadipatigenens]|uniref:Glycine cleavage system H protein n=1 Tax=Virgisporangium aliadipatigenens TaxID=741659 RepID=A0A8J3YHT0_9ACTN|nr:glycine cleavage system protein GcvH [Virgisporangium aliadipatigenens]GIJ44198.1 glycine cleavage system H protein [Virgisporangium aliadipatigenens]
MTIPENLRYTAEHEWVSDAAGTEPVRVGITDFAQDSLGDVVYVQLPEPGTQVTAGESLGEVESTKSVSEIYAPVSGEVVARNDALNATPELLNSDPYGEGWLVEIRPSDAAAVSALLDAAAYRDLTEK